MKAKESAMCSSAKSLNAESKVPREKESGAGWFVDVRFTQLGILKNTRPH